MNANENLLYEIYKSFRNKDLTILSDCYAGCATFSDPVFTNLNKDLTLAMFEKLMSTADHLWIDIKKITANRQTGRAEWLITYTCSLTGRKIVQSMESYFIFKNGKIGRQIDYFNFYSYIRQLKGLKGLLWGWAGIFKDKVQNSAMRNLNLFLGAKKPNQTGMEMA